jgi:hypothetical protein
MRPLKSRVPKPPPSCGNIRPHRESRAQSGRALLSKTKRLIGRNDIPHRKGGHPSSRHFPPTLFAHAVDHVKNGSVVGLTPIDLDFALLLHKGLRAHRAHHDPLALGNDLQGGAGFQMEFFA